MVGLLYATKELVFGYGQLVAAGFIKRGLAEDSTPLWKLHSLRWQNLL